MSTVVQYVEELKKRGFQINMTEEKHCYENAVAERVNGILKDEFFLDQIFFNMEHARKAKKMQLKFTMIKEFIYLYNSKHQIKSIITTKINV